MLLFTMLFTPPLTFYLTFPLPTPAVLQKIQTIHPDVTAPRAETGKMEEVACLENGLAGLQLLDDPEAPPTSNQEGKKIHIHTQKFTQMCTPTTVKKCQQPNVGQQSKEKQLRHNHSAFCKYNLRGGGTRHKAHSEWLYTHTKSYTGRLVQESKELLPQELKKRPRGKMH